VDLLSVPDRATLSNMAPEYGATMGYFPPDERTLEYLRFTGRNPEVIKRVEWYLKEQGLFRRSSSPVPDYKEVLELNLSSIEPSLSGPKRPQDRIPLSHLKSGFQKALLAPISQQGFNLPEEQKSHTVSVTLNGKSHNLTHGDVVIAAITSCTNTSNPSVMIAAGLLAKKALEKGLKVPPFVKTSLAPGSKVVTDYLHRSGLLPYLEQLGFNVVGYGCTTCIGNSGPLPSPINDAINEGNLVVAAVLSGNRNFTGRIHPAVKASYLASPPLVVAFSLAGSVNRDLTTEPIGRTSKGEPVYLKDIWPSPEEIASHLTYAQDPEAFGHQYAGIETSNSQWNMIEVDQTDLYPWDEKSTYIQEPPFFESLSPQPEPIKSIKEARILVIAGDSVTTDHISPAGNISPTSPAGQYLISQGVPPAEFNQYGARRGN
ncbi:MAG: aconitate hydratase, partial [bacterium]